MRHLVKLAEDKLNLGVRPLRALEEHLEGAAQWLLRAQAATPDDGVAHSYDVKKRKWHASYPETTGYIIPTLLDYAHFFEKPVFAEAAIRMAHWECDIQLKDGGVRAGTMDAEIIVPTIFNTGQVLFGLARAYRETGDDRFAISLRRAADWLVEAQDEDGAWRRFPSPFTSTKVSAYNTRSAFGLVRAFESLGDERYLTAAIANVRWVISTALPNFWIPGNCLIERVNDAALTHTIAYSIRGILEVGKAAERNDFIEHALAMARATARAQRSDGALPGQLSRDWQPIKPWTCVTGNSQMSINWQRLARIADDTDLLGHAVRANRFNMGIQDLVTDDGAIRGALKGSHPINGGYMTWRYPNWAAKFFMDALMLELLGDRVDNIG